MALPSLSDSDLAAIGGVSTFVLASVAVAQMRHSGRQTAALEGQVQVVREAAEKELDALREQIAASIEQGEAVREAARAQLQPIVFAHAPPSFAPPLVVRWAGRLGEENVPTNRPTGWDFLP